MELSLATGFMQRQTESAQYRDLNDVLRILHDEAGYKVLDLNLAFEFREEFILRGDEWEKKVDMLGDTAAKTGVKFYQCHMPYVKECCRLLDARFQKPGYEEYFEECTRRAYAASARLDIQWAVIHPYTCPELNYENQLSLERNHLYYDKFVEMGIKSGVGTAIENMTPSPSGAISERYCEHYDQLIELADSFHDPMVGICWDTGHANLAKLNQKKALMKIGRRLKTLHINDNHGEHRDEHLLPYMGTVNWNEVTEALAETGYEGSLNYEVGKVSEFAPAEIRTDLAKLAFRNGLFIKNLLEKAENTHPGKPGYTISL